MERIGIAASKIAKGNLFLYNFFVLLVTFLFSLLVFLVAGSVIVIVLIFIAYVNNHGAYPDLEQGWIPLMVISLQCLAVVISLISLYAIGINVRLKKR